MWLTRVFLKRPTLVFVFIAVTLIAAAMALQQLVVQEQPNSSLPGVTVSVSFPGASTTELQTEVALPIENQLAGTPYLVTQSTTIESGSVTISATFSLQSTNPENIANVEKAIQSAQRQLPAGINPPTLRVANPSEPVVVTLALISNRYAQADLGTIANNTIVPTIEQLPGVASVNVQGTTQATYTVSVDPNLLAANNLTVTDVVGSITPNNLRAPGGYVYQPSRETQLDVRGDLATPDQVAELPIHVTFSGTASASATGGAGSYRPGTGGAVGAAKVPRIVIGASPQPAASGRGQPPPLRGYGTAGATAPAAAASRAAPPGRPPLPLRSTRRSIQRPSRRRATRPAAARRRPRPRRRRRRRPAPRSRQPVRARSAAEAVSRCHRSSVLCRTGRCRAPTNAFPTLRPLRVRRSCRASGRRKTAIPASR